MYSSPFPSAVVDEEGHPLVLFHGTPYAFESFDLKHSRDGGFHFGDEAAAGWRLADLTGDESKPGNRVLPVRLHISNPMVTEDAGTAEAWRREIEHAKAMGHDGIRYLNRTECDLDDDNLTPVATWSWIAFHPNQIEVLPAPNPDPWFAGSKVRESDGTPTTVFHGTSASFETFQPGRSSMNYGGLGSFEVTRQGLFFTEDREFAASFALGKNARVMEVQLCVRNPLDLTQGYPDIVWQTMRDLLKEMNIDALYPEDMWELFDLGFPGGPEFVASIRAAGFDGVKMMEWNRSTGEACDVWVVFQPEQVRSVAARPDAMQAYAQKAMDYLDSLPRKNPSPFPHL